MAGYKNLHLFNKSDVNSAISVIRRNYDLRTKEHKEKIGHDNFNWLIYVECNFSTRLLEMVKEAVWEHSKGRVAAILPDRPKEIAKFLTGEPGSDRMSQLIWEREFWKWYNEDYLHCAAGEYIFIPIYDDHDQHGAILL